MWGHALQAKETRIMAGRSSQSGLCYMCDTKAALQNLKPRFRSNFIVSKASIIEQGHWGVQRQEEKVAAAFLHAKHLQSYMGNVCLFSS